MNTIKIIDNNGNTIAEHTSEHALSHYGSLVWCIHDDDPTPGPAVLETEGIRCRLRLQPHRRLAGLQAVRWPSLRGNLVGWQLLCRPVA